MGVSAKELIASGKSVLGLEFGSTRIKAVIIDEKGTPIATGGHNWENKLVNNIWTYDMEDIWNGMKGCYSDLKKNVKEQYGITLTGFAAIGVSGMMHGYLPFNGNDELLVPFRTWRNTMTKDATEILIDKFNYNIPQRWSIAHLYQAILNGEEHVKDVRYFCTLAAFIHWQLTGEKVIGIGEGSGMFPIDIETKDWNARMVEQFDELVADQNFPWKLIDILPKVLVAGEDAGRLTEKGALLLDPEGDLKAGIPMCAPEGDAGTGMAATNSVTVRTGNVSAGTSVFLMAVLEKELSKVYKEIDMVTTPAGDAVAMVHCNNCTSDLNAWVNIFKEFMELFGMPVDMNELFGKLYNHALTGDDDCGGLLAYNYFSGEHITKLQAGRPMFVRKPDDKFTLANFMRVHLYTSLGAIATGMKILNDENVQLDNMYGHGGLFKTKGVGQRVLAAAINAPVSVMETAGEGGPWGMALLASYMVNADEEETLSDYLANKIYGDDKGNKMAPIEADVEGYKVFLDRYTEGLAIEQSAVDHL